MSPGIIFLIVLGVFALIGLTIYLMVALSYRKQIKNFKLEKEPQPHILKCDGSSAHKFAALEQFTDGFGQYYTDTLLLNYLNKQMNRCSSMIHKCKVSIAKKDELRFFKLKSDLLKRHKEIKQHHDEVEGQLRKACGSSIDRTALPYFPKEFVLLMTDAASKDIISKSLESISGCICILEKNTYSLFTPSCVLVIDLAKRLAKEEPHPKPYFSKHQSTETSYTRIDREVVRTKWRFQRRDGGPDLRYNGNYATYEVNVYLLTVSCFGYSKAWTLYLSADVEKIESKVKDYENYIKAIDDLVKSGKGFDTKTIQYQSKAKHFSDWFEVKDGEITVKDNYKYRAPANSVVYIPEGIGDKIAVYGFFWFSALKEIHIPSSVKVISRNAFRSCNNLEKVVFEGEGLEVIEEGAFEECPLLKEAILPSSLKRIDEHAFYNCPKLTKVNKTQYVFEINDTLTDVDGYAFMVSGIKEAFLNTDNIKNIKNLGCFDRLIIRSDISLENYDYLLLQTVDKITIKECGKPKESGELFCETFDFEKVYIPLCVSSIRRCSLSKEVITVIIPESVVFIDDDFLKGKSFRKLYLPEHLKDRVKVQAGVEITYTKSEVVITDTLTVDKKNCNEITDHQLAYTKTLIINELFDGLKEFIKKCKTLQRVELNIKEDTIPESAFFYHETLEEVMCSDSVTTIGEMAFGACNKLKTFVAKNIKHIHKYGFSDSALTDITFATNAETIGEGAFYKSKKLKEATLMATSLGEGVFRFCPAIEKVTLNPKIKDIPNRFFEDSKMLKEVVANIKTVGAYAFSGCENIDLETLIPKLEKINEGAFKKNKKLTKIKINDKVKTISDYAFQDCSNISKITVNENIRLSPYCLAGTAINDISFVTEKTKIATGVFADCVNIKTVRLPYGFKQIPSSLFEGCKKLTSIYIPDSVISIGRRSFYKCESLKEISGMSELFSIGLEAFAKCKSIKQLVFPQSLNQCVDPISGCTGIEELVFTSNLKKLSLDITECKNLQKVYCPLEVEDFMLKGSYKLSYKTEFCCVRGSSYLRTYKNINIKYIPKEDYQILINRFLLQKGYSLLSSTKKIEMSEKFFGKFDDDFEFDADELGYKEEKPAPKKRAGYDTVVVKEEDKSKAKEVKTTKKDYTVSVYNEQLPFDRFPIKVEINKELLTCDDSAVSTLFAVSFNSEKEYEAAYSFMVSNEVLISNVVKIENIKKNKDIKYNIEINSDTENGVAYIVFANEEFKIVATKKVYIDRAYNIDALLDF